MRGILAELELRAGQFSGELRSIYFGGGTPSLWRVEHIAEVIAAIRARFGTPQEVTLEANPTDCTVENVAAWRAAGINRISIGVQSLAPAELVQLGRDHRFGDGPAALATVMAAGIAASCDFILGTPTDRAYDMSWIDKIDCGHLSVYELTIEERTAFGQRVKTGRLIPREEDTLADLYIATDAALTARGYEHYEISSYARPGQRAIHNSLYWRCTPFLGLGVGAASLTASGERATNPRRAKDYLAAPGVPAEVVTSTPAELRTERAWLGMRTSDGVSEADLTPQIVSWLLDQGLAERSGVRICPTLRGFLMANRIAARIAEAM